MHEAKCLFLSFDFELCDVPSPRVRSDLWLTVQLTQVIGIVSRSKNLSASTRDGPDGVEDVIEVGAIRKVTFVADSSRL